VPVQFRKITIIGVGLLGGSIGLAARRAHVAKHIVGFVRNPQAVAKCSERFANRNFHATTRLLDAVSGADLIILCTPISQMLSLTKRFLPALEPGAIVTDVGSVKTGVVRELEALVASAGAHFVGGHPMAGGERTGVAAARPDLFENKICVLTPTKGSDPVAVRKVAQFWRLLGARILKLRPARHDLLVSRTSHLPHVVAATLANTVLETQEKDQFALLANGFRDTTRIASGSPVMWRDIAIANRKHLANSIGKVIHDLKKLQNDLNRKKMDINAVSHFFHNAKKQRDNWLKKSNSTSSE
jgi:prephenate dehydrogenase